MAGFSALFMTLSEDPCVPSGGNICVARCVGVTCGGCGLTGGAMCLRSGAWELLRCCV